MLLDNLEYITMQKQDTDYLVDYQSGCLGWNMEIAEYLIQNVLMIDDQTAPYPPELINNYGISESDKEKILTEFHRKTK